jgi:hypothetical protein
MARSRGLFGPSERALEFGRQYTIVLEAWAELFSASAKLSAANVRLGEHAQESAKDWDELMKATGNAPWNWMNPEAMRQMMGGGPPKKA